MSSIEPSLSYGQYDERPKIGRCITYLVIIGAVVGVAWVGYIQGSALEKATIGEVKSSSHVIIEQKQGETMTITQENRQWLNNVVKEKK